MPLCVQICIHLPYVGALGVAKQYHLLPYM